MEREASAERQAGCERVRTRNRQSAQSQFSLRGRRVLRATTVVAACGLAFALVRAQPGGGPLDDAAVQALMTQFHVPGVGIAVVKDFKIAWARGYGTADVETGAPVTTDT